MDTKKRKAAMLRFLFIFSVCLLAGIAVYKYAATERLADDDAPAALPVEAVKEEAPAPAKQKPQPAAIPVEPLASEADPDEAEPADDAMADATPDAVADAAAADSMAWVGESAPVKKKALSAIYIAYTKSLFSASDASVDAFLHRILQSDQPAPGHTYYRGENGRIESMLTLGERGAVCEILVCYDADGHPVDRLEIGMLSPNGHEKKYAAFSVSKLSVFEQTSGKTSGARQERVTEYTITPQLYLKKGKIFTKLL
jgi:hypothetical protein